MAGFVGYMNWSAHIVHETAPAVKVVHTLKTVNHTVYIFISDIKRQWKAPSAVHFLFVRKPDHAKEFEQYNVVSVFLVYYILQYFDLRL